MIIGTVRPEEARVFDQYAGYHSFHAEETQEPYGSAPGQLGSVLTFSIQTSSRICDITIM
jgi:hypothetical protein